MSLSICALRCQIQQSAHCALYRHDWVRLRLWQGTANSLQLTSGSDLFCAYGECRTIGKALPPQCKFISTKAFASQQIQSGGYGGIIHIRHALRLRQFACLDVVHVHTDMHEADLLHSKLSIDLRGSYDLLGNFTKDRVAVAGSAFHPNVIPKGHIGGLRRANVQNFYSAAFSKTRRSDLTEVLI